MKPGDKVVDKKTGEICTVYGIYPKDMMSLSLRDYEDTEADVCVKQEDFVKIDLPRFPSRLYVDVDNRCVVAKNDYDNLIFTYIAEDNTFNADYNDRQMVDIRDLTDEETLYNKKILALLTD